MSETLFVDQWLRSVLAANASVNTPIAGRMFADLAPQESAFPLVVWSANRADDVVGQGMTRIMTSCTYVIKVIGQTRSYWDIEPIYHAMDNVLHGAAGTTVSATVFACMRWSEFRLAEFVNGKDYRHLGGLYQIEVQRIPVP